MHAVSQMKRKFQESRQKEWHTWPPIHQEHVILLLLLCNTTFAASYKNVGQTVAKRQYEADTSQGPSTTYYVETNKVGYN